MSLSASTPTRVNARHRISDRELDGAQERHSSATEYITVLTRAGTYPRHGPGSESRGSTGMRLAHRPGREPVNDLAAGPARVDANHPAGVSKAKSHGSSRRCRRCAAAGSSTRRQRTRSLARTCQGSQHRHVASADNTIARVHQMCPAGRRSSRAVGEPLTPTAEQADAAHPQRLPETENLIRWAAASRCGDRPR